LRRRLLCPGLVITCLLLGACSGRDSLSRIEQSDTLRVVSRNSATTYYVDRGEPAGFEYALLALFAADLGVSLKVEPVHNIATLFAAVAKNQADLAAAGLAITPAREQKFSFTSPYATVKMQAVYVRGKQRPRRIEDLYRGTLVVLANSSQEEYLRELQKEQPRLLWQAVSNAEPLELLEMVSSGAANYAIVSSSEFHANHVLYPTLKVGFTLEQEEHLAWALRSGDDNQRLLARANAFLARIESDGTLAELWSQYFERDWEISNAGTQTFNRNARERLPVYLDLIKEVAEEFQMDWQMLAAIAYQESHWDPRARSPTGVRGMMMLTNNTAGEMKVTDRLDPAQSLRGGARYLKQIKRRLPAAMKEPDRTWFGLAAYNIGRGHLEDARVLTERQGGNPNTWEDVSERLPLLQKSKYYRNTRYGYARGSEPVKYVRNVKQYRHNLEWRGISEIRSAPRFSIEQYVPTILRKSSLSAL
jgi:membrane-bound lytic murein transglycosylase F